MNRKNLAIRFIARPLLVCFGLFLLVSQLSAQRQRIDSLLIVLQNSETDSARAETMNWIGEQHQYIVGDPDSALYYFKKAEQSANDAIYVKGRALHFQGRVHLDLDNHGELLRAAREAQVFFQKTNATNRLAQSTWLEAMYYASLGPLEKALELLDDAAVLADSAGNYEFASIMYSNMGSLSSQQGKRQEAIKYMLQAVAYRKQENLRISPELLSYIGSTYVEMEEYERALPYFNQAIETPTTEILGDREDKRVKASIYQAISRAFIGLDQYDSAKGNLARAQALNLEINDGTGIANYYESLGDISFRQEDLNQAIAHYQQAKRILPVKASVNEHLELFLNLAESNLQRANGKTGADLRTARTNAKAAYDLAFASDLLEGKGQAAFILYQVHNALSEYKIATQYASEYITINDSLLTTKRLQAVSDMQAKYDTDTKQLEIDFLNKQKEQADALQSNQRQIIIILVVGITGIFVLLFIIYRTYLQKKKANDQLSVKNDLIGKQNEEREILLKEIHHRVKNNLQVISSLLDLQGSRIEDESLQLAFEDGQSRVQAMALIHQKLYQNDNIGLISFQEYAEQLCTNLESIYAGKNKINIDIEGQDAQLDIDTAIPVGLILNELISNAFKYAFPDTAEGSLQVKLKQSEAGSFEMTVSDSGPGMPDEFNFKKAKSLGLRLVRRLSQQLYGSYNYHFDKGASFVVTFKDTQLRKSI